MNDPFNLKPLWDSILAIYNEVTRVCERHGLRYYAADGTALGAMRHNGFIPWDDDLDIFMPRPDYEKFKDLASKELPDHLKFVCHGNTPEFKLLFGKVQDCRRDKIESIERDTGRILSNGLFIDVFPLDGFPATAVDRFFLRIKSIAIVQYIVFKDYKLHALPITGKIRWWVGFMLSPLYYLFWRNKNPYVCLEKMYSNLQYDNSEFVSSYDCTLSVFRKKPLSKDVFGNGVEYPFCGQAIRVPSQCEVFLENEYGDWQALPPEEDRHPTHEYAERCAWWLGPTGIR